MDIHKGINTLMRAGILYLTLGIVGQAALAQTPSWKNGSQEKMCGLGTYHDSLDLALRNAIAPVGGETLVTVQVLPSFRREYALILNRNGEGVRFFRATFQNQLWTQLGPPLHVPKTRQECLDAALAAKVDVAAVPIEPPVAEHLWELFSSIDLETDSCPRDGKNCGYVMDGTSYVVQTKDHRLRITETGQPQKRGLRSENPALLDWIHHLLQTAAFADRSSSRPKHRSEASIPIFGFRLAARTPL